MAWNALVVLLLACIDAHSESYDEKVSIEYIWMNQATDYPIQNISSWAGGLAFDHLAMVRNPKVCQHGFPLEVMNVVAEYEEDECVVIFRGSKTPINYIVDDFNIVMISPYSFCPKCKVHEGFFRSWQGLRNETLAALTARGCDSKPLRITGHSLGAGMAALAAFDLAMTHTIKHVYTFGQPRTGNAAWVDAFMNMSFLYFRVVNYMDPVPRLPSTWMGVSNPYQHAGPEVFYTATQLGSYHICRSGEDKLCADQFSLVKCIPHGCDHCSYLGMNPCHADHRRSDCIEPRSPQQRSGVANGVSMQNQVTMVV